MTKVTHCMCFIHYLWLYFEAVYTHKSFPLHLCGQWLPRHHLCTLCDRSVTVTSLDISVCSTFTEFCDNVNLLPSKCFYCVMEIWNEVYELLQKPTEAILTFQSRKWKMWLTWSIKLYSQSAVLVSEYGQNTRTQRYLLSFYLQLEKFYILAHFYMFLLTFHELQEHRSLTLLIQDPPV